jgi:CheY-like chemotaxis protein
MVDDNAADVFLVREALQEHGVIADLTVLTNGQTAMSYFASIEVTEAAPTLVLLDVNLPRKNGLAVLEALRSNPALSTLPVVTSSESQRDRNEAERLHVSAFVRKSMDLREFLRIGSVVKELLPGN